MMNETASTSSSSSKAPIFICMAIMEEAGIHPRQQHQQQPTASSSSGAHSGSSPPPSMSSGASSASQDSAIFASSLTNTSSSSPLPPPDPSQEASSGQSSRSQNVANSGGIVHQNNNQNAVLLHLAWISLDPLSPPPDMANNESISGIASQQYKLDTLNAMDQLKKISNDIEQRHSAGTSRQNWLMCSRRSIRQSLYPFCAQALLAKLTEEREEQVLSASLPLPPIFHRFLPFPLMNSSPPSECYDLQQNIMMETGNGGGLNGQNVAISVDELLVRRLNQMAIALMESTLWQTATKLANGIELESTKWMEPVQQGYRSALCLDGHAVNPRTVVRARGLPWQVSDLDIALFFAGLDIANGGIALCLGSEGRRNGECLIRFERPEHRDWALERHRRHLRQRYIEVYRAGADEFVRHAVGTDRFAIEFALRAEQQRCHNNSNKLEEEEEEGKTMTVMIVRMRGLPFTATEQQIRDFFASDGMPSGILDQGVLFVHRPDGRPSGDAFVLFGDEQSGRRALQKHRQQMGNRYIELFRTTQAEVQQLFNARKQAIAAMNGVGGGGTGNTHQQQQRGVGASALLQQTLPVLALGGGLAHQQQQTNGNKQTNNGGNGNGNGGGQQQQQQYRQRDCLRLRGLPYEAQVQQVVEFMGPQHARHVLFQGVHMIYNAAGHPSGEAFIQMESEQAANNAAQECHNKFMELGKKKRYIEVFQCCAEDMSLLLNVLPTPPAGSTASAAQIMPPPSAGLLTTPNGGPLPPLIPLATGPFPPQNGAPVPPLLAFPTATGQFLPPTTLGTPNDPNGAGGMAAAAIMMPQFATPFAHLFSPETAAHFGHSAPPSNVAEFWLRNGFVAAGALRNANGFQQIAAPNTFAPTPLFAPNHQIAVNGTNGGAAHFGGAAETAVKLA